MVPYHPVLTLVSNPDSGMQGIWLVESGTHGFGSGVHLKESELPLKIVIQNPISSEKDSGI